MNKIYCTIDLTEKQLKDLRGALSRDDKTAFINIDIEGKSVVFAVNGFVIFKGKTDVTG
jgi:hypothetical protein